jgi:hypothetical protein
MKKTVGTLSLHRETLHHLDVGAAGLQAAVGGVTVQTCGNPCTIICSNVSCTGSCVQGGCKTEYC